MTTEREAREVERTLRRGLTVAELIEQLLTYPPEAKVVFVCDYGDYAHTQQALPVCEAHASDDEGYRLKASAYSQSGLALYEADPDDDEDEDDEEASGRTPGPATEEEPTAVVILR
jgi:hypothetical protein